MLFLWLLAACDGRGASAACEASLTASGTVPRVTVEGAAGDLRVEFGEDGAYDRLAPITGDEALLLGLRPLADVAWRVTSGAGDRPICEGTVQNGNVPSGIADLEVTVSEEGQDAVGLFLITTMGADGGVLLLDREGNPLWGVDHGTRGGTDARLLAGEGAPTVLMNEFDLDRQDTTASQIVERGFDGSPGRAWATPGGHHVFEPIEGRIAFLTVDVRPWRDPETGETLQVAGDAIGEVSMGSGLVRTISSTWDWLPVERHDRWEDPFYPGLVDWTHANSLHHDPESDRYLMSLANAGVIAELDGSTGMPARVFGPHPMMTAPADVESTWRWAHDASWTPDGTLLMFATSATDDTRGALELEVDEEAGLLRKVWSYGFDEVNGHALGQALRLENGNTLVNFGDAGVMREVTPAGEVVWEVQAPLGTWFGQVHTVTDLYAGR